MGSETGATQAINQLPASQPAAKFIPMVEEHSSATKCNLVAEVVRTFGEARLRVAGLSMLPTLLPGDLVTVERCGIESFRVGEIVEYSRGGRLITHRVVEQRGNELLTLGDSTRHCDAPVQPEEIVGKVVSIMRGGERMVPRASLNFCERVIAGLARRSLRAARIVVLILNRRANRTERTTLCEN
jgi:signal peptidase I